MASSGLYPNTLKIPAYKSPILPSDDYDGMNPQDQAKSRIPDLSKAYKQKPGVTQYGQRHKADNPLHQMTGHSVITPQFR